MTIEEVIEKMKLEIAKKGDVSFPDFLRKNLELPADEDFEDSVKIKILKSREYAYTPTIGYGRNGIITQNPYYIPPGSTTIIKGNIGNIFSQSSVSDSDIKYQSTPKNPPMSMAKKIVIGILIAAIGGVIAWYIIEKLSGR